MKLLKSALSLNEVKGKIGMGFKKLIKHTFQAIEGDWKDVNKLYGVGTDTRENLTNKLFIPLKGENFDGHDYIAEAIKRGARASLWRKGLPRPKTISANFPLIRVEDPLVGLQELAQSYLKKINPKVIAITGSNGKTTTKDLVYSVCQTAYQTHGTEGNFNNHIGLPLTILAMPEETEVLVLEMGMNHFGEIERLSEIAEPDIAIITNIGESHIEFLGSREGITKAKLEVISHMKKDGLLIYDGDEPLIELSNPINTATVGFNKGNDYWINDCRVLNDGTTFKINQQNPTFKIPLIGKHQAKNAVYSYVVGQKIGLTHDQIQQGLANHTVTNMRFETIPGRNGAVLINDAYNASPTSMRVTIDTFTQLEGYQEKILVLGDMLELGMRSSDYHIELGKIIPESIDILYTTGNEAKQISQNAPIQAKHFSTKEALINELDKKLTKGTIILFKASRGLKFEEMIEQLKED